MKISAAVFSKPETPFRIETLDLAEPRTGEVLVKVAAVGVCHSDWHLMTGATPHPVPCVAGHEGAGIVEATGPGVSRVKQGDQVALNWAPNCGSCFYCLNGRPSLCGTYVDAIWAGTMLDGTTRLSKDGKPVYHFSSLACFAEYAVVPQECCVPVRREVPLPVAALIGCAVTTGVGAVLNTARVSRGSSVVVYGAGGVGLSIILGARYAGAGRIIAVDRFDAKRERALQCGATDFLPVSGDTIQQIQSLTEGRGADYVFEAIGIPAVQEECLHAARPGGTVVLAGISPVGSSTNLPGALITRQEKTIMGSYYGTANTAADFPRYADLFLKGDLPLNLLISKRYSLDQINQAYADLLTGVTGRGIIVLNG